LVVAGERRGEYMEGSTVNRNMMMTWGGRRGNVEKMVLRSVIS